MFEDHSSGGTYVDGARVTRLVLSEPVVVTLGNPVEGASLRLVPVPSAPPETPEAPPAGATSPPLVANEAVPSAALPQLVVNEPVPSAAPPPTAPPMTPPVRGVPRGAASQVSIGQLSNVHEIAGRVRIGRAEDNDIVLPDLLVSHHHAELRVSPGGLYEIEDLQSHNGTFVDGALKNGVSQEEADRIFGLLEYFAGYGFNKSHSAAYALITYQTAAESGAGKRCRRDRSSASATICCA